MVVPPDSVFVVGLPGWLTVDVPAESVWDTLETIVSGSIVAVVAFWLARRRFKSERWHERKGEAYGKLNRSLQQIRRATGPLARAEDRAEDGLPSLLMPGEAEELLKKAQQAEQELVETFAEFKHMLSPQAERIVQKFFDLLESDEFADTTMQRSAWHVIVSEASRDFSEVYQVDVGPDLGFGWRARRMGRWMRRQWYILTQRVRSLRWRFRSWWDDQKIRFGPQLTQADVRTPPRYKHFQTVEQMEKLGWSKVMIQRKLREQLRADPPPWNESLPPEPRR